MARLRHRKQAADSGSRGVRWIKRALYALGGIVGGVLLLIGVLLLSLNLAPVRAKIAHEVSQLLSTTLYGKFELTELRRVGVGGLGGLNARVRDDAGNIVLELNGADASFDSLRLIRSLLGKGALQIRIPEVQAASVTVYLEDALTETGAGTLAIAHVFSPRPSTTPPSAESSESPAPVVLIEKIRAQTIVAIRSLPGGPLHVSLENVNGLFRMDGVPLIRANSSRVVVRLPPLTEPYVGALDFTATLPDKAEPLLLRAQTTGTLGGVHVDLDGVLSHETWRSEVHLEGSQAALEQLKLGFAPNGSVRADIHASGDFQTARAAVKAHVGSTALEAVLGATFSGPSLTLNASSSALDPRDISAELPSMKIPTTLKASVDFARWLAHVDLVTGSFAYQGRRVEPLQLLGFASPTRGNLQLTSLASSQVYVSVSFDASNPKRTQLRAKLDASHPPEIVQPFLPLAGLARVQGLQSTLAAEYVPATQQASARLQLDATEIAGAANAFAVHELKLTADTEISAQRQYLKLEANARQVNAEGVSVSRPTLQASGNKSRINVRLDGRGELRGKTFEAQVRGAINLTKRRLEALKLEFQRAGERLTAQALSVEIEPAFKATGVKISGIGDLEAQIDLGKRGPKASLSGTAIDLAKISRLLAPLVPPLEGRVEIEGAVSSVEPLSGSLDVLGRNLVFAGNRLAVTNIQAVSQRDQLNLRAATETADNQSSLQLELQDLDVAELRRLAQSKQPLPPKHGKGFVKFDANLSDSTTLLAQAEAPIALEGRAIGNIDVTLRGQASDVRGQVALSGIRIAGLEPSQRNNLPSATEAAAATAAMKAVRPVASSALASTNIPSKTIVSTPVKPKPAEHPVAAAVVSTTDLARFSTNLDVSYTGQSQALELKVGVREQRGAQLQPVATIDLSTRLPGALLKDGQLTALRNETVQARVELTQLRLGSLPSAWVPPGFTGHLSALAEAQGTWGNPSLTLTADGQDLMAPPFSACPALHLNVQGNYDRGDLTVDLAASRHGQTMATLDVSARAVSLQDLVSPVSYDVAFVADEFSLTCIPYLVDYGIEGTISGNAAVKGNARDENGPQLTARFESRSLMIVDAPFRSVAVNADLKRGEFLGSVRLAQTDGHLEAELRGRAKLTQHDQAISFEAARLGAKNFEIAPASIFLSEIVSDLRGKLTGAVAVTPSQAGLVAEGRMALSKGSVNLIPLGQQLDNVSIDVRASRPGEFEIASIHADSMEGKLNGSGSMAYDKQGLSRLDAALQIPRTEPIPVFYQGVRMGELKGQIKIEGRRLADEFNLAVFAPELDAYVTENDMSVQNLTPADNIRVGTFVKGGAFVELGDPLIASTQPVSAGPSLKVTLGNNVWVHRGQGTAAAVEGALMLGGGTPSASQGLNGELRITQGQIDVVGKIFEVRYGTVTFGGEDPPDPVIVAEAVWPAPSGHSIIARFSGPASRGQLELSSEPPLSESEILNVVVFGDPEGDIGAAGGGGSVAGAGTKAASSVALSGFGRAISDLSTLDVQASVETSDENSTKTEVQVRISPRITAKVAYNAGASAVSRTPDSTLVSLGLRLSKRWSVETQLGNAGTTMADFVWRYRY